MNYQKIYDDLVADRKKNPTPDSYYEMHHIIPKCMGGDDSKKNLVRLTAREHFIAHWLLAKIHGGKMWWAVKLMSSGASKSAYRHFPTSRQVDYMKKRYAESVTGKGNPFYGKSHSSATLKKIRSNNPHMAGKIKGPNHHNYGKKYGEDFRAILSFVKQKKPHEYDTTIINQIHKSVGLRTVVRKSGRVHRVKPKALLRLARYFRGINLGASIKDRDITGKNNPNYGNSKVSGKANGRYNHAVYTWQSKHTGELLSCTCFEAYTNHGMSKAGVITCISGRRLGVKGWWFLGEKGKEKGVREIGKKRQCRSCDEIKPIFGFPKGKAICKICYAKRIRVLNRAAA